jgi:PEP-CTERM motif
MKDIRVRVHRRRRQRRMQARTKFLVVLLFAATAVVTWQFARQRPVAGLSRSGSARTAQSGSKVPSGKSLPVSLTDSLYVGSRPSRPAYAYSIIPGGVESAEELRQIVEHDPVAAQEFQGFDYQNAHLVTVSEKQSLYVAYRKGDKVYWTKKKIDLHPGETLISDGKIVARTRCGNRVAVAPLGPPGIMDPLQSDFDQPLFSNEMVTNAAEPKPAVYAAAIPSAQPGAGNALQPIAHHKPFMPFLLLPPIAGIAAGAASSPSAHTPLAVAPEPGTMLLLSSGLVGVYLKARKSRRKR